MPRTTKNHEKRIDSQLTLKNIFLTSAFLLILIGTVGLISSSSQNSQQSSLIDDKNLTPTFNLIKNKISTDSFNVLSSSTSRLEKLLTPTVEPSPTPTPQTSFRHSKWLFSFEFPEEATVEETDPATIMLIANSSGGALITIPEKMQIEVAVVQLQGMNLFQYYHNRLATIFDDKILFFQEATKSANLKGYEISLQNETTKQNKTLLFLNFRGSQIFEIEAVYFKPNHKKEVEIFKKLIESLKPY